MAPFELFIYVIFNQVHWNVPRSFIHDLHSVLPGAEGEFTLNFEFGKLRSIIGVGDGAGAETVADRDGYIVGRHNGADIIPVGVQKVFLLMSEAPLGHDGPTTRDDTCHALCSEGNVLKTYAGVDSEIVDSLLGLFNEGVAVQFPGEGFGATTGLFKSLVNGDGSDGYGAVAQNPFSGLMDIFPSREIHKGVASPFTRPAHFLNLFIDR